jgi:hypothetical protein
MITEVVTRLSIRIDHGTEHAGTPQHITRNMWEVVIVGETIAEKQDTDWRGLARST